jgi:GT2 family glycosyltransferase
MNALSASIVAYKDPPSILYKTIHSFLTSTTDARLYIIHNSPTDELRGLAQNPRVRYIFKDKNVGFGAGHNIVLRQVLDHSKYHLVLNPDVYFGAEVLPALYDYMESHGEVGQVMPKVLYPDGRLQYLCKLLPTPKTLFLRRFLNFLRRALEKENFNYEFHFSTYEEIMDGLFLSRCFMLLWTSALKKVGLFDERFFLYAEDMDLTRRIHKHCRTVFPGSNHLSLSFPEFLQVPLAHGLQNAQCGSVLSEWGWMADAEREHINYQIDLGYLDGYRISDKNLS